jgi:hypothetical protein
LHYLYDFGDGWGHTIKIECIDEAVSATLCPQLLEPSVAAGRRLRRPLGHEEFLAAHTNPPPQHEL